MLLKLSLISIDYYGNKIILPVVEEFSLNSTKLELAKEIFKTVLEMPEFKSSATHITWQYLQNDKELSDFKQSFFAISDSRKMAFITLQKEDYAEMQELITPFGVHEYPTTTFASIPVIVKASENSPLILEDLLPNLLPAITLKLNRETN